MAGTVSAFMRRLHAGASRMGSLVAAGQSRRIDRARASVTVVAIQSLHEQAQRFVVGALLNTHLFPDVVKYTAGTLSLAVAVGTIDRAQKWALSILSHRILTQAGLWSFSLYLWQQPFTKIITHWPRPLKLTLLVAAALASFYLVERPARRYLNQVWANRQRRVPAQIVQ